MITFLSLLSIAVFVGIVGGVATRDAYRQTHTWAARHRN
jgi:hypothetical protein